MTDFIDAPTAREDELDLLACCLSGWNPTSVDITGPEFDDPRHESAWQAMVAVANGGGTVSPDSVRLALGPNGDNAAIWLLDVFQRPVVPANAPALAARIRRAAQLRSLQDLARGVLTETAGADPDPGAIVERIRARIDQPVGIVRDSMTLGEALPMVLDEMERGQQRGLSTPWPSLDKRINGISPGQLVIVAARPGVGKSLMAQNLAWHWSHRHELPVYFASLEMSTGELVRRTLAQVGRLELSVLSSGKPEDIDWDGIDRASPAMKAAPLHLCTDPSQTIDSIRSGARKVASRHGLGMVVVDYLQLVTPRDRRIPREQQVSEIARGLKLMAKELDVPVVALSQIKRLNDGADPRRPSLSDLRESGAIEQDADDVLILHIPDEKNTPWEAELLVAKARHGQRGEVDLNLVTKFATIATPARAS